MKKITHLICKYGTRLCALAMLVAPMVSQNCTRKYYQSAEPVGFTEFAQKIKSKNSHIDNH